MRKSVCAIALALSTLPIAGTAGIEGNPALVMGLRAYWSGAFYVDVDSNQLCGTPAFVVNADNPGFKIMYSNLLSALLSGKHVKLEAVKCTGWGSDLQGVMLLSW